MSVSVSVSVSVSASASQASAAAPRAVSGFRFSVFSFQFPLDPASIPLDHRPVGEAVD